MSTLEFILINLFGSVILTGVSFIFSKFPPKKINGLYGYRTGTSMKNQEQWDFSQAYASRLMLKGSVALFIVQLSVALITQYFFEEQKPVIAGVNALLMIPMLVLVITKTELTLKKKFRS
jgi:uncharacterized membrane protein